MAIEIVSFPIKNGGSFHIFCMFTRGYHLVNIANWKIPEKKNMEVSNAGKIIYGPWLPWLCEITRWYTWHISTYGPFVHARKFTANRPLVTSTPRRS